MLFDSLGLLFASTPPCSANTPFYHTPNVTALSLPPAHHTKRKKANHRADPKEKTTTGIKIIHP
jgi:hypothetical protein